LSGVGGPAVAEPPASTKEAVEEAGEARAGMSDLQSRTSELIRALRETNGAITGSLDLLAATPTILPTDGWVTSLYSRARVHPVYHTRRAHEGIDVAARPGTPILAAANGSVIHAGRDGG